MSKGKKKNGNKHRKTPEVIVLVTAALNLIKAIIDIIKSIIG